MLAVHRGCTGGDRVPPPRDLAAHPRDQLAELASRLGPEHAATICAELLTGAQPTRFRDSLLYLGGRPAVAFLEGRWAEYWPRVWAARGLLYVWAPAAEVAVVAGLGDPAWRVAEMTLKVSVRRKIGPAGPGAARLVTHDLARVRLHAVRALGGIGDTEHVALVEGAMTDDDGAVRKAAAHAFDQLAGRLDLPNGRGQA